MGRRRKGRPTEQLPNYVYRNHGWYIYREYKGRYGGKTLWGKDIRLCTQDKPLNYVWEKYQQLMETTTRNLSWLLQEYQKSKEFKKLAARTQEERSEWAIPAILRFEMDAPYHVFGNAPLEMIDTVLLTEYLDQIDSDNTGTLHIAIISKAWKSAMQRHRNLPNNPCPNVITEKSKKSERYVTDEEYYPVLNIASPVAYALMEIGYICRAVIQHFYQE